MSLKYKFTEREVQDIQNRLEQGVVNRASATLYVLALLFSVYGVLSTGIISKYDPSVTLWSNSWPRLLFNGIPFTFLAFFIRKSQFKNFHKSLFWALIQPAIFVAACCVHVWPLMLEGHLELYKYFHAANMFVITFGFMLVAPSRPVLLAHVGSYILLFLIPLLYISRSDSHLSAMIVNDFLCMTLGACVAGDLTYRLRKKIAFMDAQIKSNLTPLLGSAIASAIYSNSLEGLNNKRSFGLILSMDLRGYTKFMHSTPREISSRFMKEYHFLVSTTVGKFNGFIHKTAGDSHLISFGLMDESPDLSDLKDIRSEVIEAEILRAKQFAESAVKMFDDLLEKYQQLKLKFDVTEDLKVGAALAAGSIEIQIVGNENYRQEVNIDGDTIVRSARLEAYTKLLMPAVAPNSSMLIISPEIIDELGSRIDSELWHIQTAEMLVRDYPQLNKVYYKSWAQQKAQARKLVS